MLSSLKRSIKHGSEFRPRPVRVSLKVPESALKRSGGKVRLVAPAGKRLRSRFRAAKPIVTQWAARRGRETGAAVNAPNMITVRGRFSRDTVSRTFNASVLPQGMALRWATIQAGQLPEDEEIQRMPGDDQIAEKEAEMMLEVEAWGRAREEEIQDETQAQVRAHNSMGEMLDAQALAAPDVMLRRKLKSDATRAYNRAADAQREGAAAMARVAEQVNEQRFEIRQQINRSLLQIEEAIAERIGQLKNGLIREVEAGANRYYFGGDSFEVESFKLID